MKQYIRKIITACENSPSPDFPNNYGVTPFNVDEFLSFTGEGSTYLKFLAVLLHYKVSLGNEALGYLINKYGWNKLRVADTDGQDGFIVEEADIDHMWEVEDLSLNYDDKLDLIVQVVYEETKGNSRIDELLYQNVSDISIGISGIPGGVSVDGAIGSPAYVGCWIRYNGCPIHFRFISFGSHERLKEIAKQGVQYQMKGQFSEKEGFKLGYGKDGSRRSASIEPFGESPALWVRKFTAKNLKNEELFNEKPGYENVIAVEKALIKGGVTIPICGAQGSGKTTKLEAIMEYVQPFYSIRVLESEFEARLRWKYPNKNIYTIEANENTHVTPADAYNFTLRTAGDIYVIGEARSDDMIVNVTRTANRGGRSVVFTFHPNRPEATINEIANALIREKLYTTLKDAVATALNTVQVCIFAQVDLEQNCHYQNIYEFVPRPNIILDDFKDAKTLDDAQRKFMETQTQQMRLMTSADIYFDTVPIIVWDREKGRYEFKNQISDRLYNQLLDNSPLQKERDEVKKLFGR